MPRKTALEEKTGTSYAREKRLIYRLIRDAVRRFTGERLRPQEARAIFDLVVEEVMSSAVRVGSFRFNGGHGVLHMHTYEPYPKKLPGGDVMRVKPEPKLKLKSGRTTSALFRHGGDLAKALDERGHAPVRQVLFESISDEALDAVLGSGASDLPDGD